MEGKKSMHSNKQLFLAYAEFKVLKKTGLKARDEIEQEEEGQGKSSHPLELLIRVYLSFQMFFH